MRELNGHVLKCVKDQNGNHVVQKCIERVRPDVLQFIVDAFRGQARAGPATLRAPGGVPSARRRAAQLSASRRVALPARRGPGVRAEHASLRLPRGAADSGALQRGADARRADGAAPAYAQSDPGGRAVWGGEDTPLPRPATLRGAGWRRAPRRQDQYGNYVIQHVLERGGQEDRGRVIAAVRGSVLALSQHKFASNVLEKCIMFGTPSDREDMIRRLAAAATSRGGRRRLQLR